MTVTANHVCAECTDFIGGGDWGLCCKSMEYNDLCHDHTQACERFKPGRKIRPVIFYDTPDGEHMAREFSVEVAFWRHVELAKKTIAEGNANVRVVDLNGTKRPPLLWNEEYGIEVVDE